MVRPDSDRWLVRLRAASATPGVRLICFPYAGGSPDLIRAWADGLSAHVELLAVRLPGKGPRLAEGPYTEWEPLIADTYAALAPCLNEPHAFYGHSFGARLAYELAHVAGAEHGDLTRHLFVSGSRSPRHPQHRPYMHELTEDGFLDALRGMGGTPAEVLDDKVLMRLFLPTIRAEIRLAELWGDRHGKAVNVPVTALYGQDDPIDGREAMRDWKHFTERDCELLGTAGGHFFLETHRRPLLDVINARLEDPNGEPRHYS
ncbi:thioesterase domain-containing protein [Streptomyces sp. MCA2]|uniref:thioesterase II family protein n=1 Tax=Streptomyces sp. MCA2 TaxID=2944805 RepID=UPI00201FC9AF|nr:alpha/beta fold hydrolase [Streptomyces sp. MCA2]MCL7491267.1 thioesterase domain-containing protein [Streptomyces sp. MCA2]